jgi:hypothetical protein
MDRRAVVRAEPIEKVGRFRSDRRRLCPVLDLRFDDLYALHRPARRRLSGHRKLRRDRCRRQQRDADALGHQNQLDLGERRSSALFRRRADLRIQKHAGRHGSDIGTLGPKRPRRVSPGVLERLQDRALRRWIGGWFFQSARNHGRDHPPTLLPGHWRQSSTTQRRENPAHGRDVQAPTFAGMGGELPVSRQPVSDFGERPHRRSRRSTALQRGEDRMADCRNSDRGVLGMVSRCTKPRGPDSPGGQSSGPRIRGNDRSRRS